MRILYYLSILSGVSIFCLVFSFNVILYIEASKVQSPSPEFWKIVGFLIFATSFVSLYFIFSALLDYRKLKSLGKKQELFENIRNTTNKINKVSTKLQELADDISKV